MKIELENLFIKAINEGCSIFTGAGFSLLAKDSSGQNLPLGQDLEKELIEHFKLPSLSLPKLSAILEKTKKAEFYNYLINRFSIESFDPLYKNLESLNIRGWFTTNIDNLPHKLFLDSNKYYLNDNSMRGPALDKNAIQYYPLHGCVENKTQPFIFSPMEIATIFQNAGRFWNDLAHEIEKHPTLFWGYSLNDTGILETLNSINVQTIERKQKWIVLHKENPGEEMYFKSLGFNIIISSIEELLQYVKINAKSEIKSTESVSTKELFGRDFVPASVTGLRVRELNEFYLGDTPIWSDIFSKQLYLTSHFQKIQNLIFGNKNVIVIGTPASGKTTLLMQLAAFTDYNGHKILLNQPSIDKCRMYVNILKEEKAIFFIDNFTDDIETINFLTKFKNVRVLAFDREHEFEIISHKINRKEFEFYNVTELTDQDIQEIYSRIPESIRNSKIQLVKGNGETSLFEFINVNIRYPHINERFKNLLEELEKKDYMLTDFLILSSYVHQCRIPLTFDMASNYFGNLLGNYREIYELRSQLGDLIKDYGYEAIDIDEQDYFIPRSLILSEAILEQCNSKHLQRVLYGVLDNLPSYQIVNYHIFKKKAYDKRILIKAFPDHEEGKHYYERLLEDDKRNPYLWQQGALYLLYKRQYFDAFIWIEKAINLSDNRIFSIRNSHAIILFDANIFRADAETRPTLDRSMDILQDCYLKDKKKLYHAKKFSEQAIEYYTTFPDKKTYEYLKTAQQWLVEELQNNSWDRSLKIYKRKVDSLL